MNAKIRNLQVGTMAGVTYVKDMLDLICFYVILIGSTAILKIVKNFAKRHVTYANHL